MPCSQWFLSFPTHSWTTRGPQATTKKYEILKTRAFSKSKSQESGFLSLFLFSRSFYDDKTLKKGCPSVGDDGIGADACVWRQQPVPLTRVVHVLFLRSALFWALDHGKSQGLSPSDWSRLSVSLKYIRTLSVILIRFSLGNTWIQNPYLKNGGHDKINWSNLPLDFCMASRINQSTHWTDIDISFDQVTILASHMHRGLRKF